MAGYSEPICHDDRPCFGRVFGRCRILTEAPKKNCSFCKPEREVTKGKFYGYKKRNNFHKPEKDEEVY